ncbi:MAG: MBL fold metallo-hydrolase [Proteobacteria bacterium]|nr:MBL fold metallo-hydrolase [Pseudomonadota bacterium]
MELDHAARLDQPARLIILYDAFGRKPDLTKDWGYAALIEVGGRRILFDTGKDGAVFEHNVDALKVDLRAIDFAVISHRHIDHVSGISHLVSVNPNVKIYGPKESFGIFGSSLPSTFYRKSGSVPDTQRYYGGYPPSVLTFGSLWPDANIIAVDRTMEVSPGIHLIALGSEREERHGLLELSLAIQTAHGLILIVGCAHPGIARILDAATKIDKRIRLLAGGLHFAAASDTDIAELISVLKDEYRVQGVAPGHCTGEPAFAALSRAFGDSNLYAGLGEVITVGALSTTDVASGE